MQYSNDTPASDAHAPSLALDSPELAREYERVSAERQLVSGQRLVAALAIAPGERVLDVGCGTGRLAAHIAGLVGPTGHVLGFDPLPLRIEIARARAAPNLAFRVGSAYELDDLADGSFDVVCLNAVFHWLPDKAGPLRAFARILRRGGRIGLSSSLQDRRAPLHEIVQDVLARPPFGQYPRATASLVYRVEPPQMHDLLAAAGFGDISIDVVESVQHFESPEAAIRYSEASSFGNFLGHLPEDLRPTARDVIAQEYTRLSSGKGIDRHVRRIVAIATKV